ncbi:MAG: aminotransferase class I/II-fold pyridoxal phosphate-dependent enzyme [Clostridiaceae bacterium]|nr:aminotransferase class I/II-fold pyridoxal phosphate-dependent enzyme [Clostridiaceae bacterium]
MERYEHGGDTYMHGEVRLDFSVNINPLGMPEQVREAIATHIAEYQRYPDPYCRALREAIARHENVAAEDILCGNGAADLIYRLCLSLRPKRMLVLAPTFSEYERAALLAGAEVLFHRLREENGFALTERILDDITADVDMVFLCNPNNPTGQLAEPELMERISVRCMEAGALLIVDECFLSFTRGISCKSFLQTYPDIVILDAFTKLYAMAGVRLGHIITKNHGVLSKAQAFGQCWSVSAVAQAAGLAALECHEYVRETQQLVAAERAYLAGSFEKLGLQVFPGCANYILFKSEKPLLATLLKKGLFIRSCGNYEGLDRQFYRVCVMQRKQNEELVREITKVLRGIPAKEGVEFED